VVKLNLKSVTENFRRVGSDEVMCVKRVEITDFILWRKKGSQHYTGYARYFGLRKYECIIKKTPQSYVVLLKVNNKWEVVGKFFPYDEPQIVRGDKEYEFVGKIWTPNHTFFLLKNGDRFIGV